MAINSEKFRYNSIYRSDAALHSVFFSHDMPLLETELNEIQDIQNELRQSISRALTPSGFFELIPKNSFSNDLIIFQPQNAFNNILNSIAIAPCKAIINGMTINLIGTYSYNKNNNYLLLDLGEAPLQGEREDLVYLEVWLERLGYNNVFYKEGNLQGPVFDKNEYQIVDSRVGFETTRRVVVHYAIKICKNVDFNTFPNGFGYINKSKYSNIQATVQGQLGYDANINLIFCPATHDIFIGQSFYNDPNLYIAGRPDYTFINKNIIGNYIFALPMFRIKRHNQQPYSLINYNGSRSSIFKYLDSSSIVHGDLLNNIRPDKEYYDIIYKSNIIDIRRTISPDMLNEYYLNKGLYSLFTGELQTKEPISIRRAQFGIVPVDINNDNIILHVNFNNTFLSDKSDIENNGEYSSLESKYKPIYKDSISSTGLYIDGRAEYKYNITNYNINNGTLDFYIQPYWDGHSSICQTLFTIYDINGNAILICTKQKSELQIKIIYSASSAEYTEVNDTIVIDLTEHLLFAKRMYILRLSWSNDSALSKMFVYLNGNIIGEINYYSVTISPASIVLGNKNDAVNNGNLILNNDEDKIIDYEDIISILNNDVNINTNWLLPTENEILYNNVAITQDNLYIFNHILLFANEILYRYNQDNDDLFNMQNNFYSLSNIIITDLQVIDDNGEVIFEGKKDEYNELIVFDNDTLNYLRYIKEINYRNSLIIPSSEEFVGDPFPDLKIDTDIQYGIIRVIINEQIEEENIKSIIAEEQRRLIKLKEDQYNNEIQLYEQQKQLIKQIKEQRTNNNYGFVIEELTLYNRKYEEITANAIINSYWPNIPNDFLANQALILPSFNSIYRGYSDNSFIQEDIIEQVSGKYGIFIIEAIRDNKIIIKPPKIYDINGKIDYEGHILTMDGTWKYLQDKWIFTAKDTTLTSAIVTYSMDMPNGNGGEDLPVELLAAGLVDANKIYQECAFARLGTTNFRPVKYINTSRVSNEIDLLYDHSTIRTKNDCYARIVYYHMSGNSTNCYRISQELYGLEIINIIRVTNNKIINVKYIKEQLCYEVYLQNVVSYGEVVEFMIALGGWIFDYETQTKTLVSNICKTTKIKFFADGINTEYLIPVYNQNGGILKAVCSIININNDGEEEYKFAAYVNNEMYPKRINYDTNINYNQLAEIIIDESSWNTPFLKLTFNYIPPQNAEIIIPVLITYQPREDEILSLWYKIFVLFNLITKSIFLKFISNLYSII